MSLRERLIRHEGLRLLPYRDSRGKLTIGCGRNLDDVGISRAEALYLLDNDISERQAQVAGAFPWIGRLNLVRQDVLVEMAFNLGIGGLQEFGRMLAAAQAQDFAGAASEMRSSRWAAEVGDRAQELARTIESGADPDFT